MLRTVIIILIVALILSGTVILIEKIDNRLDTIINHTSPAVKQEDEKITIIIDAGHGGGDGGAVALDGTLEKDLNLLYANALRDMLTLDGVSVVMTRQSDTMLSWEGRTNKSCDLRARLEATKVNGNAILVSIHMNKFPQKSPHGTTVYYSKNNPKSIILAEALRADLKNGVKEAGERPLKEADSAIYLLNNVKIPAVLVECGFVSNEQELMRLKTDEYRTRICAVLRTTLLNTISENKHNDIE